MRGDDVTVGVHRVVRLLVEVELGTVEWFNLKFFGNLKIKISRKCLKTGLVQISDIKNPVRILDISDLA